MSQSENDNQNNNQESEDHQEVERKERTTPRQLWESRRQKGQADDAARRLNVQPVNKANEENAEISDKDSADGQTQESKDEQRSMPEPESMETSTEPSAEQSLNSQDEEDETMSEGEMSDNPEEPGQVDFDEFEKAEEFQKVAEEEMRAAESKGSGGQAEGPQMVGDEDQPGMMRYPYATHGPAPEDEDVPFGDKIVPSSFVLGIIIIVGALLIGLALVAEHSRIVNLENRVDALESAISQQQDVSSRPREE